MKKISFIACLMMAGAMVGCSKDMDQIISESSKEKKTEQVLIEKKEKTEAQDYSHFSYMLGFEPE